MLRVVLQAIFVRAGSVTAVVDMITVDLRGSRLRRENPSAWTFEPESQRERES